MSWYSARGLYLIVAIAIAASTSMYTVWRYLGGGLPGANLFKVYGIVNGILVISWLVSDPAIPIERRPSFDHAMFVWMTFPLLGAYYMFSAHRWRGFLIILGLLGLLAAPNIVLALVHSVV